MLMSSSPELSASSSTWVPGRWSGGCWLGIHRCAWMLPGPAHEEFPAAAATTCRSRTCASGDADRSLVDHQRGQPKFLFPAATDDSADLRQTVVFVAGLVRRWAQPVAALRRLSGR